VKGSQTSGRCASLGVPWSGTGPCPAPGGIPYVSGRKMPGRCRRPGSPCPAARDSSYDALEWLAAMGAHAPGRGRQPVRCHGSLSNASTGKRRKEEHLGAEPLPTVLEPQAPPEGFGKNSAWARLIHEGVRSRPAGVPHVRRRHACDRIHHRPGGRPQDSRAPGTVGWQAPGPRPGLPGCREGGVPRGGRTALPPREAGAGSPWPAGSPFPASGGFGCRTACPSDERA